MNMPERSTAAGVLPAYAELYCISNFSFLGGASFPDELVRTARALGYAALAVTDECSLSGVVRAQVAAKEHGIKLIIGAEFRLREGCRLVLLARNRKGYGELSHLISRARRDSPKGGYRIDRALLERNRPGDCLLLWLPEFDRAPEIIESEATWLRRGFAGRVWIAVEMLLRGDDHRLLRRARKLGRRSGLPLCAAGGACMHTPERRPLKDLLDAIRLGRTLAELGLAGEGNGQRHLRGREQLARLHPPALLVASVEIADLCDFSLDELRYEYPLELVPAGYTAHGWLCRLTLKGMRRRPKGAPAKLRARLKRELALIRELRYEHYFLTVHDIVAFARGRGILCQGRGSAANSAVCYCLGITAVDPARIDLLFERFVSRERDEPPDIDVDSEHSRREEVIQHIYRRYGRDRAALAATVIRYRPRSAVRDVGKTLGLAPQLIDHLAKSIHWWGADLREQLQDTEVDHDDPQIRSLLRLTGELQGFPRHLSQHVGGFVISRGPLSRLVPIENAAMAERTVIQWEKDDLEALGLLKIDVLALGMLTAIRKCLDLIGTYSGQPLSMDRIPAEDPQVYDMICRAGRRPRREGGRAGDLPPASDDRLRGCLSHLGRRKRNDQCGGLAGARPTAATGGAAGALARRGGPCPEKRRSAPPHRPAIDRSQPLARRNGGQVEGLYLTRGASAPGPLCSSGEIAVQIPVPFAAAFAVNPQATAVLLRADIIVAVHIVARPPAGFDSLRATQQGDRTAAQRPTAAAGKPARASNRAPVMVGAAA